MCVDVSAYRRSARAEVIPATPLPPGAAVPATQRRCVAAASRTHCPKCNQCRAPSVQSAFAFSWGGVLRTQSTFYLAPLMAKGSSSLGRATAGAQALGVCAPKPSQLGLCQERLGVAPGGGARAGLEGKTRRLAREAGPGPPEVTRFDPPSSTKRKHRAMPTRLCARNFTHGCRISIFIYVHTYVPSRDANNYVT